MKKKISCFLLLCSVIGFSGCDEVVNVETDDITVEAQATQKAEFAAGRKTRYGYDAGGNLVPMHPGQKSVFTSKQVNKYWDVFHKMQQDPLRGASAGSQEIRRAIYDVMIDQGQKRKGVKTLEKLVAARIDELYENDQEKAATADAIRGGTSSKL